MDFGMAAFLVLPIALVGWGRRRSAVSYVEKIQQAQHARSTALLSAACFPTMDS